MSSLTIDLFVEDIAQERFIAPLLVRVSRELNRPADIRIRSAKGGYSRVIDELKLYQSAVSKGVTPMGMPSVLVIAVDANCKGAARRSEIMAALKPAFANRAVVAAPDPHIERWYLSDSAAFRQVVGVGSTAGRRKCERDLYKKKLIDSIRRADQPAPLGGVEFGPELAIAIDPYRLGKSEPSFKRFYSDAVARIKQA